MARPKSQAEKKVERWLLRVPRPGLGTLTSPDGAHFSTMDFDPSTGVARTIARGPVYNHEAGEQLYNMVRSIR